MSQENAPRPQVAKVESENNIEKEIGQQEAALQSNTSRFRETLVMMIDGPTDLDAVAKSVNELIQEINTKFSDRAMNWALKGMAVGGAIGALESVGGMDSLEATANGVINGGLIAVAAAAALWSLARAKTLLVEQLKPKRKEA